MTSGFILKKRVKNTRGRFHCIISKQNIKLIISPLLSQVRGQYGYQKKQNYSEKSKEMIRLPPGRISCQYFSFPKGYLLM